MIITPRFIFLHLHKSGGTFVNHILTRIYPQARAFGYHAPRTAIPEPLKHLPLVGTIRNPWSYYVSWYFFQESKADPNALFRTVSENGSLSFNDTIANLADLGNRPSYCAQLIADLPDELPNRGLNLNKASIAALEGYQSGFYSYLVEHMYGDLNTVHMMQMENLREDLLGMLRKFEAPLDDDSIEMIKGSRKRNTSEHAEFSTYYDDATRKLVAQRDTALIERFEYRFDA